MECENLSSNWKKLQLTLQGNPDKIPKNLKRKRTENNTPNLASTLPLTYPVKKTYTDERHPKKPGHGPLFNSIRSSKREGLGIKTMNSVTSKAHINAGLSSNIEIGRYVSLDCEMVGVGPEPDKESALARVSIVNYDGDQIYDSYVKPLERVTDWRTHISGVTPKHMLQARSFAQVQLDVSQILQDRTLIGHSIRNDLSALMLSHPKRDIRDTARHPPYRTLAGGGSPKLKLIASELLGLEIQEGEHSSIDDARACMLLFRRDKDAFEREHSKNWPTHQLRPHTQNVDKKKTGQKKKKRRK